MLNSIINKVGEFFGLSKPYDFPILSRDKVLSILAKEYEQQREQCEMIERVLNKKSNIETVIVSKSNVKAFKMVNTGVVLSLTMLVSLDLYKHCQYYGITEFEGFEIKENK